MLKTIATIVQPGPRPTMPSDVMDALERLPPSAQTKLRRLREKHEGLKAVERATSDKLVEALEDKQRAEGRLRKLREDRRLLQDGDNHPSMKQALSDLKRASEEAEYRQELLARHRELCRLLGGLLTNGLEPYLKSLPADIVLEPYGPTGSALRRGERPENGLKRVRAEIGQICADMAQVQGTEIPTADANSRMRDQVEQLRQRSAPDVRKLLQHSGPVEFPSTPVSLPIVGVSMADGAPFVRGDARGQITDTLGLIAWLFPDLLIERLEAQIAAQSDDTAALTADDREARIIELRAALLDADRREEAIICLLEQQGADCIRRIDADPRAVLGIVGPPPVK